MIFHSYVLYKQTVSWFLFIQANSLKQQAAALFHSSMHGLKTLWATVHEAILATLVN